MKNRQVNYVEPLLVTVAAVGLLIVGVFMGSQFRDELTERVFITLPVITFAAFYFYFSKSYSYNTDINIPLNYVLIALIIIPLTNILGKPIGDIPYLFSILKTICLCLLIGVSEEVTFRGVLYRAFYKHSQATYIVVSSIIFGVVHFQKGMGAVFIAIVIGAVLGLARVSGMSLYGLIVIHAIIDLPAEFPHDKLDFYEYLVILVIVYCLVLIFRFLCTPIHWQSRLAKI